MKSDFYANEGSPHFVAMMDQARKHNDELDKVDHASGFSAPTDGHDAMDDFLLMRTAMCAIQCGLNTRDNAPVAEGLTMLQDLELRQRAKLLK